MKYTVELYVTHEDKEYWEIDIPANTDVEALAIKIRKDPYILFTDLEGDMVDSDHVETFSQVFKTMYETYSRNPVLNSDLEDDVSP